MSETTMYMTPPPVAPHLLRRSSSDRIFGGVCGGLGRYWNVDPVILRVVFG
ncbi:MAG: PspC domain-containing protein, partial [Micrococcales bacterium]|nr:PspC domain-containing protein [Micrococcales bacterium]